MSAESTTRRRLVSVGLPLGVLAVHVALVLYFCPPRAVLSHNPVFTIDHVLHYGQASKAQRALSGWGQPWVYDPYHLAGTVEGALLDSDNKATELWVFLLAKLGVYPGLGFNLLLLLIQLALPLAGYGAARLLGFNHRGATLCAFLYVVLWFFDFFLHWCWFCGMYSYAAASYLCVLCLALFYRFIRQGGWGTYLGLVVVMCVTHLVHPYSFFILVLPLVAIYVRAWRRLALLGHLAVAGVVVATVGANLWWIVPSLRFRHYLRVGDSGYYLQTTLSYLVTDYLDLLQDAYESGAFGVRTAFRVVIIVAAVGGLWAWRRARDTRFLPWALVLGWLFALAYLGGYLLPTRYLQPYRHMAPFTLLAVFPAAAYLLTALRREQLRGLWRAGAGVVVILLALAVPRLAITALSWFHPHVTFKTRPAPGDNPDDPRPYVFTGLKQPPPPLYRLQELPVSWPPLAAAVRRHCPGRVLVRNWMLAEYLSAFNVPVLGGFPDRVLAHSAANLFHRWPQGEAPQEELAQYLERYAVGCLVVTKPTPHLERQPELFELAARIGEHRVYTTRQAPSYLAKGTGRVRQSLNQIVVDGAAGDELVLRFHWMETLRCQPGCDIERVPVPGDQVGFIRVRRPPPRLSIYNSYQWQ